MDELACKLLKENDSNYSQSCLSIINEFCEISSDVCSKIVCEKPELQFLDSLQYVLKNSD